MDEPKISLIIPTKNERDCLPRTLEELPKDLLREIIVVDAQSSDGTAELARKMGCKVLTQEGKGYGIAVDMGIKHAVGELISIFDADGSYDPAALKVLLQGIEDGNDVVFCSRYLPESGSDDDTIIRYIGNRLFSFILRRIYGVKITDSLFDYFLAKREALDKIQMTSKGFERSMEFPIRVHNAGLRYTEIPSKERRRIAGSSKLNAFVDGLKILWVLLKNFF